MDHVLRSGEGGGVKCGKSELRSLWMLPKIILKFSIEHDSDYQTIISANEGMHNYDEII